VLLDIEGTTTPISFVYDVLFPYARARLREFLRAHWEEAPLREDVARLGSERQREAASDAPPWNGSDDASRLESAAAYALWLMDHDRKSTALKSLQGRIWQEGYRSGALRGDVYADVPPALERLRARDARAAIYSSGSILAQKLLFSTTPFGDLTPLLAAHFDTTTGPKTQAESYGRIAAELSLPPGDVLFVSDAPPELDAARAAGLRTALCVRAGELPAAGHQVVRSLDSIV
jgi:enolase-phosphatase E1